MAVEQLYQIVRFFADPDQDRQVILDGLTLEEARDHCNRDDSYEPGVWFDGYEKEPEC